MKIAVLKTLNKEFDVYQFRVCTCVRACVCIHNRKCKIHSNVNVKYILFI